MKSVHLSLANLVTVDAGFKPAVHLPDHFDDNEQNAQLIRTYIPTSQSISFLAEVARSLNPSSDQRARILYGTFGTGKSDLLLILCNYFSRSVDDPVMRPFYEKLRRLSETQYSTIYEQRANKLPFLVVLLQANAVTPFPGFILHGLEQALKDANLEELILPTRFSAARQKLDEWQREGHPVLQRFKDTLRDNEAKDLTTLTTELSGPGASSVFAAFQRTFRIATGTEFDIYSYDRPEETYKRVAQALRERGSHSGILVVCDEFTEILRRMARAGDQQSAEIEVEALGVQDLANTSMASGKNQLHFVVASLQPFASASAESTSESNSKVIEKIGGRFKAFELELQDSAELIRGAIQRLNQTTVLPNRQYDELLEIARPLWRQPKQWVAEMVVDGCFPLHPLVTYALPQINRLVAQTNRTMFQFLKDREGLSGYIARHDLASSYPDWSNLLTLDVLFDYFEKSIQVRRSEVVDAYNHSLQLLARANVDTTLAQRTLKIVAFCEVVAPALSPNRQLLRQALNLPPSVEAELGTTLALLEQLEAVYPPSDAEGEALGAYSLPMSGRVSSVNLRQRVIRKARELQPSITRLQSTYPAEAIRAEEYNRRRGSWRELKAKYVSPADLNNGARLKDDLAWARDGLLWYVIASSESERSEAQSRARELTRLHARLVVAVPIGPLNILETLKNFEALDIIRGDNALDSGAKAYLQDTGLVGKGFHTALTTAITKLREEKQWEWFREGSSQPNIINRAQAQDLASKVMNAVYPATPEHQLAQHFKPDGITPSLTRAMIEVLKGEVRISRSGSKPDDVILRTALTGLGLLKSLRIEGPNEFLSLVEPTTNYNSQKIWQLYRSHLSASKPWRKLIDTLRDSPYGLYDSLLVAYTATFLTYYADAIEITSSTSPTQQAVALDEKMLKQLIESSQSYNVRLQPLTDCEKQWLRGIVTGGLRKTFEISGGQGKTLRSRVASQVRNWLSAQHLPLFAEKLSAEQIATLMPNSAAPVIAAAVILLQGNRAEEAIASALLKDIPEALKAPSDHSAWTDESVHELLSRWGETCRLLERLVEVLEQHAVRAIATVFGYEHKPAEEYWSHIYHWRINRRVVQSQVGDLSSYARELFAQTNKPGTSVRESILDGFARVIVGINTAYTTWSSLDHLDRLVKEVQKARDEIEARWRALASEEEVWHTGVASAALGRPVVGIQADRTAQYLHEWATNHQWPQCSLTLQSEDLEHLYPDVGARVCGDISVLLKCTPYSAEDWKRDLTHALPQRFGVVGWTKAEVEQAVARLATALKHAENLDGRLRRHTLFSVLRPFEQETDETNSATERLYRWREAHPIPTENDLDETAQILLNQIAGSADAETTLLFSLPHALPQIAQSYAQWRTYADLQRYVQTVSNAVCAIESYEPLTQVELHWMTGIVNNTLRRRLANFPREKNRLAQAVAMQCSEWLGELHLPSFASALSATDIGNLFHEASPLHIQAMIELLKVDSRRCTDPTSFILVDLPCTLGKSDESVHWSIEDVDDLLSMFGVVCKQISKLQEVTSQLLLDRIGPIFGVEINGGGAVTLVNKLRAWRQSLVLLPNEPLSHDAALVSEALSSPIDDPYNLLFSILPRKLREPRAPYCSWDSWDQRTSYLRSLEAAALEIAHHGRVSDATPHVQALWETMKAQIEGLSMDERRWLIKAFDEEFHA